MRAQYRGFPHLFQLFTGWPAHPCRASTRSAMGAGVAAYVDAPPAHAMPPICPQSQRHIGERQTATCYTASAFHGPATRPGHVSPAAAPPPGATDTGKKQGFIEDLLRISQDVRRKLTVLARSARSHLGDRDGSAGSRNVTQSVTGNDGRPGLSCPVRCERTWSNPNIWRAARVYRGCSGCGGASDKRLVPVITLLCQHAVDGGATDTESLSDGACRLAAGIHPLRQSSFRLVEYFGPPASDILSHLLRQLQLALFARQGIPIAVSQYFSSETSADPKVRA